MTKPTPPHSDIASKAHRQTSARSEQAAFQAAVKPHLQELFEAARRELRYRVALGDFGPDLLTAEELVGETLARAWRDRRRRPRLLKFRVWLLAVLFRVAEDIARDEAQFRKLATESLQASVPPRTALRRRRIVLGMVSAGRIDALGGCRGRSVVVEPRRRGGCRRKVHALTRATRAPGIRPAHHSSCVVARCGPGARHIRVGGGAPPRRGAPPGWGYGRRRRVVSTPSVSASVHDASTPEIRDRILERLRASMEDTAYAVLTPAHLRAREMAIEQALEQRAALELVRSSGVARRLMSERGPMAALLRG